MAANVNLVQTGDMDAKLRMDYFTKNKLLELLEANGLVYDEDSHLVWIPENARTIELFTLKNIEVKLIDAESTLVSKAIHAPQKNKQLIRQAIASGKFPNADTTEIFEQVIIRVKQNDNRPIDFYGTSVEKIKPWFFIRLPDGRSKSLYQRKVSKSFRFKPETVATLKTLKDQTGQSETEILEKLIAATKSV